MSYIQRVEERAAAIRAHYKRGGYGETAPRCLCDYCSDTGLRLDARPLYSQNDERGGFFDVEVVQVACDYCPLAAELEKAMDAEMKAASVFETEAA